MQGLIKKHSIKAKGSIYILEDGKAGTGPLTRGEDAVFSEQIADMKDLDGFISD